MTGSTDWVKFFQPFLVSKIHLLSAAGLSINHSYQALMREMHLKKDRYWKWVLFRFLPKSLFAKKLIFPVSNFSNYILSRFLLRTNGADSKVLLIFESCCSKLVLIDHSMKQCVYIVVDEKLFSVGAIRPRCQFCRIFLSGDITKIYRQRALDDKKFEFH